MANLILALGGTGRLVAHHWALQWLLGHRRESLRLVLLDSDSKVLPSLRFLSGLLAGLAKPGEAVPPTLNIHQLSLGVTQENVTFDQWVTGLKGDVPLSHPITAFFDPSARRQSAKNGLYRHPVYGPFWWTPAVEQSLFPLLTGVERVLVVSSLIGGTGGGLVVPALDYLLKNRVQVGLLSFGRWFRPREAADAELEDSNFRVLSDHIRERYRVDTGSRLKLHTTLKPNHELDRDVVEGGKSGTQIPLVEFFSEACWVVNNFLNRNVDPNRQAPLEVAPPEQDVRKEQESVKQAAQRLASGLAFLSEALPEASGDPFASWLWPAPVLQSFESAARHRMAVDPKKRKGDILKTLTEEWTGLTTGRAGFTLLDMLPIEAPASPMSLEEIASGIPRDANDHKAGDALPSLALQLSQASSKA